MFCNGAETCLEGVCVDGTAPDCDDGIYCSEDTCDPATGDPATGCNIIPFNSRCDDSVGTVFRDAPYLFRRSRGYAPLPVQLPAEGPPLLAVGGELKNVFCLTRDRRAFLGHHIGDLEYHEPTNRWLMAVHDFVDVVFLHYCQVG